MTHLPRSGSRKKLTALASLLAISACGDGTSPSAERDASTSGVNATEIPTDYTTVDQQHLKPNSGVPGASAISGTVIIEERNGKSVFDAFFSQNAESALHAVQSDNDILADHCEASALRVAIDSSSPVDLGAASGEDDAGAGNVLTIESRVGQFEALVKQQAGDLTVYAPEMRWKSAALPQDAVLSFEPSSVFDQLGLVDIPPLLPLVWLAPETGVLSNPAASLRWEASLDEQVQIKLRLSAIDFSDSLNPTVVTVSCSLADDGMFTLPTELQRQLPDDDMGIVVYAVRERVQEIKVENTSFKVVQLSYPAPM